jgi:hypothetical protein
MDNATQQPDEQTESQGAVNATTPASNQTRRRKRNPRTGQFVAGMSTRAASDAPQSSASPDAGATARMQHSYTTSGCGDTLWCNPPRPASERDFTHKLLMELCGRFETLCNRLKEGDDPQDHFLAFKANAAMGVINAALESRLPVSDTYDQLAGLFREMLVAAKSVTSKFAEQQGMGGNLINDIGTGLNILCQALGAIEQGDTSRTNFMQLALESPQLTCCLGQIDALLKGAKPFIPSNHLDDNSPLRDGLTTLMKLSDEIYCEASAAAYSCDDEEICESYRVICEDFGKIDDGWREVECEVDHLACTLVEPPLVMNVRTGLGQASYYLANMIAAFQGIVLPTADPIAQLRKDWLKIESQMGEVQKATANWVATQLCTPPNFCKESAARTVAYAHEALKVVEVLACDPYNGAAWKRHAELAEKTRSEINTVYSQVASAPGYQWHVFDDFWRPLTRIQMALSDCATVDDDCADTRRQLACFFQYMDELRDSVVGIDCECDDPCTALPATRSRRMTARMPILHPARIEVAKSDPVASVACTPEQWVKVEEFALKLQPYLPTALATHTEAQIGRAREVQRLLKAETVTGQNATPAQLQLARRLNKEIAELNATYMAALDSATGANRVKLTALGIQQPMVT